MCPSDKRFMLLFTFLKKNRKKKMMVFFSSCMSVKFHHELLNYIDLPVMCIHVSLYFLFFSKMCAVLIGGFNLNCKLARWPVGHKTQVLKITDINIHNFLPRKRSRISSTIIHWCKKNLACINRENFFCLFRGGNLRFQNGLNQPKIGQNRPLNPLYRPKIDQNMVKRAPNWPKSAWNWPK